ncbi:hypothetical protein HY480_01580 [Candidatus Uhrbacteria bacterium]|nr:hypothetical protein [Candidatus Uhrbacteria bacterium]
MGSSSIGIVAAIEIMVPSCEIALALFIFTLAFVLARPGAALAESA